MNRREEAAMRRDYEKLEVQLEEALRHLKSIPASGHRAAAARRVDRLDARLTELHQQLFTVSSNADPINLLLCRASGCCEILDRHDNFNFAGYCEDHYAQATGAAPIERTWADDHPIAFGSPWGVYE